MRLLERGVWVSLIAGTVAVGAAGVWPAWAGTAACTSSCPPENVFVKVVEPSGAPLWIDFIGSGSGGDSPMRDSVRSLIADGFYLRSDGTCGQTKAKACVVIGP